MIRMFGWLLLVTSVIAQVTETPESIFERAGEWYRNKRYAEAEAAYQQLLAHGSSSYEVYYNLANSCFKQKKYGYAVFFYEKALRLAPGDEDILFNLELTHTYLKDQIAVPPDFFLFHYYRFALYFFSIDTLAIAAIVLWNLLLLMLLIKLFFQRRPRFFNLALYGIALLFVVSAYVFVTRVYIDSTKEEAVILNSVCDIKSEPDPAAATVFILHEGAKVEIRSMTDEWLEIRLIDGKVGWIRRGDVGTL